jgi:hypothetical protein
MKFIIESDYRVSTLFTKERFRKKELIGIYPVPPGTILDGLESMFHDIGCSPESIKRMMDSARYINNKKDHVLDIKDTKQKGIYKIRELRWFLNIPYYRTIAKVSANDDKEIIKQIVDCMPGYVAIDWKTHELLSLGSVDEDNTRTTSLSKQKGSGSRNSRQRRMVVQNPRSKTKRR